MSQPVTAYWRLDVVRTVCTCVQQQRVEDASAFFKTFGDASKLRENVLDKEEAATTFGTINLVL